jgi:3-hydroxymyristoyl/3-hydroxydecanoyl-(acyl carrier protein) dehydratase
MPTPALPHAYPFRFVDAVVEERDAAFSRGTVRVRISANARGAMGEGWQSPLLYAEAIAQAALLLDGGDADRAGAGLLAGIEGFAAERPPLAGETLEISVRLATHFGAIFRFEGEVRSGTEVLACGSILVRKGAASEAPVPSERPA